MFSISWQVVIFSLLFIRPKPNRSYCLAGEQFFEQYDDGGSRKDGSKYPEHQPVAGILENSVGTALLYSSPIKDCKKQQPGKQGQDAVKKERFQYLVS